MKPHQTRSRIILIRTLSTLALLFAFAASSSAQSQVIWQGHTWNVTNGGMAGAAPGSPKNVSIDSNGYLHLHITNDAGKWTASELFTVDNLGFGTYQWVVQGDVWSMDPVTVLGVFSYGPAHGIGKDGSNEIDVEFSQWDRTCNCNADFTIYPSVRRDKGKSSFEHNFTVSDGTDLTTARMEWNSSRVVLTLMRGNQPIGTTANVLKTDTYKPSNPADIPQQPLPVGINFWAFTAVPATNQSVIIQSFQYVP
jgi:hypothetical protein